MQVDVAAYDYHTVYSEESEAAPYKPTTPELISHKPSTLDLPTHKPDARADQPPPQHTLLRAPHLGHLLTTVLNFYSFSEEASPDSRLCPAVPPPPANKSGDKSCEQVCCATWR